MYLEVTRLSISPPEVVKPTALGSWLPRNFSRSRANITWHMDTNSNRWTDVDGPS